MGTTEYWHRFKYVMLHWDVGRWQIPVKSFCQISIMDLSFLMIQEEAIGSMLPISPVLPLTFSERDKVELFKPTEICILGHMGSLFT